MVSVPVARLSVRLARSAFTCASEPVSVTLVVPLPLTPLAGVTESTPLVSATVTVKVSPLAGS